MAGAVVGSYFWAFGGYDFRKHFIKQGWTQSTQLIHNNHADMMGIRCLPADAIIPPSSLSTDLFKLYEGGEGKPAPDARLICADGELLAHKAVIGIRCRNLRNLIARSFAGQAVLDLGNACCDCVMILLCVALFHCVLYVCCITCASQSCCRYRLM